MRYTDFRIAEGYREVTQKFSQEADPSQVQSMISKYRDLVDRNQVQGNERNIDWWGKQGWEQFQKFVTAKSQQLSQNQQKKRKTVGNSYTLDETDEWLIVVPLDKDASCFHGKDTDWCTTKPQHDYFEDYFRDRDITLIYFLQKRTGNKWAAAVDRYGDGEYFDINDNRIGNGDLARQTGIPFDTVMKYVKMVSNKETDVAKKTDAARDSMRKGILKLNSMIHDHAKTNSTERSIEIETLLLKTKHEELLEYYLDIITDGSSESVELDQNMQTLTALKAPNYVLNITNITPKTGKTLIQNNAWAINRLATEQPQLAYDIVKNNPSYIPEPTSVGNFKALPEEIQLLFIKKDPLWIEAFDQVDALSNNKRSQKEKVLSRFFKDNPQVYAIVVEPGLTDLQFFQKMSAEEYQRAADRNGDDAFHVLNRDLKKLPDWD